MLYAGFWKRVLASIIDNLLMWFVFMILGLIWFVIQAIGDWGVFFGGNLFTHRRIAPYFYHKDGWTDFA
nr:RDD family protein [Paenibacillus sp. RC334]